MMVGRVAFEREKEAQSIYPREGGVLYSQLYWFNGWVVGCIQRREGKHQTVFVLLFFIFSGRIFCTRSFPLLHISQQRSGGMESGIGWFHHPDLVCHIVVYPQLQSC